MITTDVQQSGPLFFLPKFFGDHWGWYVRDVNAACLINQLGSLCMGMLGHSYDEVQSTLNRRFPEYWPYQGRPLKETLKLFKPLFVHQYKVRCYLHTIETAADAVLAGHPVLMAVSSDAVDWNEPDENGYQSISSGFPLIEQRFTHAVLVVGVDADERALIVRDSRPSYSVKGYVKVSVDVLKEVGDTVQFIEVGFKKRKVK